MRRANVLVVAAVAVLSSTRSFAAEPPALGPGSLVDRYCNKCHNATDWAGGVAFDTLTPQSFASDWETWEHAVRKVRGGLMPPPGEPRPAVAEQRAFVGQLESALDGLATQRPAPPASVLRRVSRQQYGNLVEDVLGLKVDPAEYLPKDLESEGFDNIADALRVSPTYLEQAIAAARSITQQAIGEAKPKPIYEVRPALEAINGTTHIAGLPLGTRGGTVVDYNFPADGDYVFKVFIASEEGYDLRSHWLEYPNTLVITVDGKRVFSADLGGETDLRATDQQLTPAVNAVLDRFANIRIPVAAGPRRIGVTWIAKTFAASDERLQSFFPGEGVDSVPRIKSVEFAGPYDPKGAGDTPSRRQIFSCHPDAASEQEACAQAIFARLARIAYRRPVTPDDLAPLMGFYRGGVKTDGFEGGVQRGLMAMLVSPSFLFRTETRPAPGAAGPQTVSDLELASRLSFLVWSRGPDETLLGLAERGELRKGDTLRREVRRMLADARGQAIVRDFAMQWLHLSQLDVVDPDERLFPLFDDKLKDAFRTETLLFVDSVLRGDRSVVDLLTADYTFVNERLARHYGIRSVRGERFQRVTLPDPARFGLLGKGAILLSTSYPDRTSPVLRGTWILENLLGTPPAAPPPNVEAFPEIKEGQAVTTVRTRLEQHRQNASCNACHGIIDPLGLALENFDATGEWRRKDRFAGEAIDSSGSLADGTPLHGPQELRAALLQRSDQFVQTFTERLLTYALGRVVEAGDMPLVRTLARDARNDDFHFDGLVTAIVQSAPFQNAAAAAPVSHEAAPKTAAR